MPDGNMPRATAADPAAVSLVQPGMVLTGISSIIRYELVKDAPPTTE